MKIAFLGILASLSLISQSAGLDLSPGNAFPQLTLPSIDDGKETEFKSLLGEKMMLHLFASW